ncbi:hypothetical protein OZN62_12400 [Aurantiacibacter sp. MUD11]|uniref:hypothetical protein n=1 Tax=Aurantiacibacter sp. MUD11 TaxID=3003265 RepID=UPI0022AACD11|nr:hypothetical protein [Aurantiacibacter sp. MUD11]WAT17702.1 hypothetical protein OZN62_12400 [Aurantiacibacter sp. MUD11]
MMKPPRLSSLLACSAAFAVIALSAAPLAAQDAITEVEQALDPEVEGGQDIVVTGELGEMHSQAREQARDITPRGGSVAAPLARMQRPVCPGVFGAETRTAYEIIGRIRSNAERIGHEVIRGEPCTANVIVAFVDDPHDEFEQLRDADHYLADGLSFWDAKRVRETESPVLAWNVTTMRNRDGIASNGNPPTFASTAISRTELGVREDIDVSVVMIRRDAIEGLDTIAIADYVTMRALAQTLTPEGATELGTILELFNEDVEAPPFRLTAFDEAYLTSLYREQANAPSRVALRDVGRLMERGSE